MQITKSRGSTAERVVQYTRSNSDGTEVPGSYVTINTTDTITYDSGPQYANNSANWKECEHTWAQGQAAMSLYCSGTRPGYGRKFSHQYYPNSFSSLVSNCASALGRVKPLTNAELLEEASESMKMRIDSTILPYTDLIQLSRHVDGINGFKGLIESLTSWLRPKSFTDFVKKAAGADLAWKWGVKPLTQTILDLVGAAERVDKHMKKLTRINMSNQFNFSVSASGGEYEGSNQSQTVCPDGQGSQLARMTYHIFAQARSKVAFQCRATYDTSDAIRTRLLWDSLGCTNLFATAWDLAPWSFLVDWFVDVSEFVDRVDRYYFKTVPLERITELTGVWAMSTVTAGYEVTDVKVGTTRYTDSWNFHLGNRHCTTTGRFSRHPVPAGTASAWLPRLDIKGQGLTLAQNITGLELLAQRLL